MKKFLLRFIAMTINAFIDALINVPAITLGLWIIGHLFGGFAILGLPDFGFMACLFAAALILAVRA